jgi:cell division septation protein DedD
MLVGRPKWLLVAGALVACALALAGCSTSIADLPIVGTPADAPARPKEPGSFLPVNNLPPDRDESAMDQATRDKLRAELAAARDRQAAAAAANASPVGAPK